jgi:hypothetical protein
MHLKYHALVGLIGDVALNGHGVVFVASIAPDLTLLFNELRLRYKKQRFSPALVDEYSFTAYHLAHSTFTTALLYFIDWRLACGHLLHTIPDWFTHTGRFSAMPLYPFSRFRIEGWEVLK